MICAFEDCNTTPGRTIKEIYKVMGECIMPREGVFTRVLHGGTISVGDELTMVEEG